MVVYLPHPLPTHVLSNALEDPSIFLSGCLIVPNTHVEEEEEKGEGGRRGGEKKNRKEKRREEKKGKEKKGKEKKGKEK